VAALLVVPLQAAERELVADHLTIMAIDHAAKCAQPSWPQGIYALHPWPCVLTPTRPTYPAPYPEARVEIR
jgi:hypothetical protein